MSLEIDCKLPIGKISVYKHCFCYSNVPIKGTKYPLFPEPMRLRLVGTLIILVTSTPRVGTAIYGHIGMCHCEGYGFQAVYSSIGYINQSVWV